jgi:lipooligosaccharide transport system permease protein
MNAGFWQGGAVRWTAVWLRNLRVWRKLIGPALLGNIGEPLLYLFALGYGLGSFVGEVQGMAYVVYLASGTVCASAMNTASFEGMYSAYTRMAVQDTWMGMLTAPLDLGDIIIGETLWGGTKSLISAAAILVIATAMGLVADWRALWVLPIALLVGTCFAALALLMTALARNYDFFLYYFTLFITPLLLLSGVFFPLEQMPEVVQTGARFFPLYHAVMLVRPLMTGAMPSDVALHLGVIALYALIAIPVATWLIRRRLMK